MSGKKLNDRKKYYIYSVIVVVTALKNVTIDLDKLGTQSIKEKNCSIKIIQLSALSRLITTQKIMMSITKISNWKNVVISS